MSADSTVGPDLADAATSRRARLIPHWRPSGWFQIGWSRGFPRGEVRPLRYFGHDLTEGAPTWTAPDIFSDTADHTAALAYHDPDPRRRSATAR